MSDKELKQNLVALAIAWERRGDEGTMQARPVRDAIDTIERLQRELKAAELRYCDERTAVEEAEARVRELEAARLGYASSFPRGADGQYDVGSIHENIRKLQARAERLRGVIENAPHDAGCQSRYTFMTGGFSNDIARPPKVQQHNCPCNCWKRAALAEEEKGDE